MSKANNGRGMAVRIVANDQGFTLTEMLAAVFIMSLVSVCMATGIQFAVRQYHDSMVQSESRMLCSTLTTVIQEELGNTGTVTLGSGDTVQSFFNAVYGDSSFYAVSVDEDHNVTKLGPNDYGELYLGTDDGGKLLLSSGAYSSYHLGARIQSLTYDSDKNVFHVSLSIASGESEIIDTSFDVVPINTVTVT